VIGGAAFFVALATAVGIQPVPAADDGQVTPSVVLLLAGKDTEPLAGRLAAELAAVGLEVQREEPPVDGSPDPVASAFRLRARGAVWVPPGAAAAEVWILDRDTGRIKIRQSITAEGDEMAPLVALRTVEFLRASLLGLRPREPAPPPPEPPPPPVGVERAVAPPSDAGPSPTTPRISVSLGGGVTTSAGGVGPIPSIAAVVRAPLHGLLGVEALGLLSVSPARVGNFSVNASLAGGGLTLRLLAGRRGSLDTGAGVMAAFVHAAGDIVGGSCCGTLAALYGRAGAGLAFTPWLGLRAEALVGGVFQRPVFRVMGTEQTLASWGRPFGSAMLDLEARWR